MFHECARKHTRDISLHISAVFASRCIALTPGRKWKPMMPAKRFFRQRLRERFINAKKSTIIFNCIFFKKSLRYIQLLSIRIFFECHRLSTQIRLSFSSMKNCDLIYKFNECLIEAFNNGGPLSSPEFTCVLNRTSRFLFYRGRCFSYRLYLLLSGLYFEWVMTYWQSRVHSNKSKLIGNRSGTFTDVYNHVREFFKSEHL